MMFVLLNQGASKFRFARDSTYWTCEFARLSLSLSLLSITIKTSHRLSTSHSNLTAHLTTQAKLLRLRLVVLEAFSQQKLNDRTT